MAKSARSSATKTNRTKIRARVFGPIETARTARLSTKLMELASQPKPREEEKMDLDETTQSIDKNAHAIDEDGKLLSACTNIVISLTHTKDMELVEDSTGAKTGQSKSTRKTPSRVQKKRRGKPQAQLTFPAPSRGKVKTGKKHRKKN